MDALNKIQMCVSHIKLWMTEQKLKLNDDKTEVLFITSPHFQDRINVNQFLVDGTAVTPSPSARNIGVMFDKTMSMRPQVTAVCQSAHFHLRNI